MKTHYDLKVVNEDGEFVYLSSDPLQCILNHLCKNDRYMYYSTNPLVATCPEWRGDGSFMIVRNQDITAHHWDVFDENLNGLAQIVKTKYPQPPFATYHVIYGESEESLISGMEFILYWNFYRPMVRPFLYRIVVKGENEGEGDDNKDQHNKKRKKEDTNYDLN